MSAIITQKRGYISLWPLKDVASPWVILPMCCPLWLSPNPLLRKSSLYSSRSRQDEPGASGFLTPVLSLMTEVTWTQNWSFRLEGRLNKDGSSISKFALFKDKTKDCNTSAALRKMEILKHQFSYIGQRRGLCWRKKKCFALQVTVMTAVTVATHEGISSLCFSLIFAADHYSSLFVHLYFDC